MTAYRSQIAYNASGSSYPARLTIDLGNDDLYLTNRLTMP